MRIACTVLSVLFLLPGIVYAEGPEVQMVNGKITMSAQSVPLGQLLSLLDLATGMTSEVTPELANRVLSVRFSDLELREAVRKVFEGQPFNYMLIEGKGIRVTDLAVAGTSTSVPSSSPIVSSFSDPRSSAPLSVPGPIQPVVGQPVNATVQPAVSSSPFGGPSGQVQNPSVNPSNTASPGGVVPGQLPPPLGSTTNPPPSSVIGGPTPLGGGLTPAPAAQPAGPGTLSPSPLGNSTPGVPTR